MDHKGSGLDEPPGVTHIATQGVPPAPHKEHSGFGLSRLGSNSACESIMADENASRLSPDASRSIRKTRSAARISSVIASSSSKDIVSSSPIPSTPFRGHVESNVKSSETPHLDHVLSFHQKVSPPTFSHDIFTSFALEADTPGSRDSTYSYFGNWRFYSSGSGDSAGAELPPNSSEDASLGDSDSSEQGHQVVLLSQPFSLPCVARSEPSLSLEGPKLSTEEQKAIPYMISRKRSKSLSALPLTSGASYCGRAAVCSSFASRRDHLRAFSITSSSEAMLFASGRRSPATLEAETTFSSFATFEFVENLEKSSRNGGRASRRPNLISKPFGRIQKVVNRLFT